MTNSQTMHTLVGSSQFPATRWTLVAAAGVDRRRWLARVALLLESTGLLLAAVALWATVSTDTHLRVADATVLTVHHVSRVWQWAAVAFSARLALARVVPLALAVGALRWVERH